MTFEDYCSKNKIVHFKKAFYHHLCVKGRITMGFEVELTEGELDEEWDIFWSNTLRSF